MGATFLFRDEVYPDVKDSLDKQMNMFLSYIARYMDRNSDILTDTGMAKRLYFPTESKAEIFTRIRKSPREIEKYIKKTNLVDKSWVILNNPENWALIMCIKYAKDHRKEEDLQMILMFYTYYLYSSLQYNYFEFANENVMDYTINNLSNKYDIKKLGNLQKALYKLTMTCYETYIDFFDNFSDENIKDFCVNLRTRINNMVKAIALEYYKNLEDGKYLNKEMDNMNSDAYYEVDNVSGLVTRLTDSSTNYIVSTGCDYRTAELAAKMGGVSQAAIKSAVENIIKNEAKSIRELINLLLQQFLVVDKNQPNKISSKDFIVYCNALYSKSNTTDRNVLRIKQILDDWLKKNSDRYVKTERVATKSNFRKSTFFYFVFMIQRVNVNR